VGPRQLQQPAPGRGSTPHGRVGGFCRGVEPSHSLQGVVLWDTPGRSAQLLCSCFVQP
jgi:hypothetical protein